jgi:putative transposase
MPRKGHSEERIVYALRKVEAGKKGQRSVPGNGGIGASVLQLERRYAGLGLNELRELRQLREENRKLKTLVADLTLDKHIFAGSALKKSLKPAARRKLVTGMRQAYELSERRACELVGITYITLRISAGKCENGITRGSSPATASQTLIFRSPVYGELVQRHLGLLGVAAGRWLGIRGHPVALFAGQSVHCPVLDGPFPIFSIQIHNRVERIQGPVLPALHLLETASVTSEISPGLTSMPYFSSICVWMSPGHHSPRVQF